MAGSLWRQQHDNGRPDQSLYIRCLANIYKSCFLQSGNVVFFGKTVAQSAALAAEAPVTAYYLRWEMALLDSSCCGARLSRVEPRAPWLERSPGVCY